MKQHNPYNVTLEMNSSEIHALAIFFIHYRDIIKQDALKHQEWLEMRPGSKFNFRNEAAYRLFTEHDYMTRQFENLMAFNDIDEPF